jgi:hypothetical protein
MGHREGRLHPPRSHSIDVVEGGPSAPGEFENPVTAGQSTIDVELAGLKDRARQKDYYALKHPGVFEKRKRKKLQSREELIKFYVQMASGEEAPAADRIRAADRIVELLGFKISKDYDSVQRMTSSELIAAVEKVAPLVESYMSQRAKGSSVTQITGAELNDPCES